MSALQSHWSAGASGYLIIAVQAGFITGTLLFAVSGLVDRYSPSKIFFVSCLAGALCNVVVLADISSFTLALSSRLLTGICLAGIYPVGMKIAADWQERGLGNWLGALVGALVVGSSLPHGLKTLPGFVDPFYLLIAVSMLALFGGIQILVLVPDGPFRKRSTTFSFKGVSYAFKIKQFRRPALGYFGHMWELYAFWAFVPWIITTYQGDHANFILDPSLFTFLVILIGGIGCWLGGKLSSVVGSDRVALFALMGSGACCLVSPWMFTLSPELFVTLMLFWGLTVVADSPQLSALVATNAPVEIRGSAITLVTCIGFSITIVSIQLLTLLHDHLNENLIILLAPGPIVGAAFVYQMIKRRTPEIKPDLL